MSAQKLFFNCNICDCLPIEPVTTPCGHIFCWPCFYTKHCFLKIIPCTVCKKELCLYEMTSLQVLNEKERFHFIKDQGVVKIPPRPICIRNPKLRKTMIKRPVESKKLEKHFKFTVSKRLVWLWSGVFVSVGLYLIYLINSFVD